MSRYLAVAGAALLLIVLLIVGGIALKSALSTKNQGHASPSPTQAAVSQPVTGPSGDPVALEIKVTGAGCQVFVESQHSNNVLQPDSAPVPAGTDLRYAQGEVPLTVEISDPGCANVYVHGKPQAKGSAKPWSFTVGG